MDQYDKIIPADIANSTFTKGKKQYFDILHFWGALEKRMPALAAVARAECSGIVTEASSERSFRDSGYLLSPYRSGFNTDHVEILLFVKKNPEWQPDNRTVVLKYLNVDNIDLTAEQCLNKQLQEAKVAIEVLEAKKQKTIHEGSFSQA